MSHPLRPQVHRLKWKMLYEHFQKTGKLENPKVLQDLLYIRAYQDFRFFATYFFSHHCKDAFSQMHVDFCQLEDLDPARRGRRDVVAAPRGNAKTTFKVLLRSCMPLYMVMKPLF